MNSLQVPVDPSGALIPVQVGLAAANVQTLRQQGQPIPPPVHALALIDIGAEVSCVDTRLLAPLAAVGLQPARLVFANLPFAGGSAPSFEYVVGLEIVHPSGIRRANFVLRNLPLLEYPLKHLGYDALLGRDVLQHCLLVYDGPSKLVTIAY